MADEESSTIQINYIIVPLLLILITIVAILIMKYQTWCAWKLFKPKVTKQEEAVQITHLSVVSVSSQQSTPESEATVVEITPKEPKSWISMFKRESMQSIRTNNDSTTILESNAIVYSGSPPSYGESHLDNSSS
jgi:hypothetical protein